MVYRVKFGDGYCAAEPLEKMRLLRSCTRQNLPIGLCGQDGIL